MAAVKTLYNEYKYTTTKSTAKMFRVISMVHVQYNILVFIYS